MTAARLWLLVPATGLALGLILGAVFDGLVGPELGVALLVAVLAGAFHFIPAAIRSAARPRRRLRSTEPPDYITDPTERRRLERQLLEFELELLRGAESDERRRHRRELAQLEGSFREIFRAADEAHGRLGQ